MSRTRIVKGKITEIIGGDYNIYSESKIVDNAAEIISDKGVAKGESYGDPEKPSAGEIKARCLVEFRPHDKWEGDYGFDWVRTGDTGQEGDKKWYRDIIGKYVDKLNSDNSIDYCKPKFVQQTSRYDALVSSEFSKFLVPWKNSGKYPYYYIIPFLSILPNQTVKLNLKSEIVDEPDSFELKFNSDFLNVKFLKSLSVETGKRNLSEGIEIYCNKEFNSDQYVEIIAKKGEETETVGKIIIVKNAKMHRREMKVTLVQVIKEGKGVKLESEEKVLKKILKQSYVDIKIEYTKLTIPATVDISKKALYNEEEAFSYLNDRLRNKTNSNGDRNGSFFDDSFRLFYVTDICEDDSCGGGYILGWSEKLPSKAIAKNSLKSSIIIFNHKLTAENTTLALLKDKSTATHELLHSIGLSHTFDNYSKYVFEQFETDNIMDYRTRDSLVNPKQIYKWQWDLIKKQLK